MKSIRADSSRYSSVMSMTDTVLFGVDSLLRYAMFGMTSSLEVEEARSSGEAAAPRYHNPFSIMSFRMERSGMRNLFLLSYFHKFFICRDYLGSITHITNASGTVIEENSYDAWGRLRNPQTHALYAPNQQPNLLLGRGYTGHEQLPWFNLVNMNARLYDPVVGRFLAPDPYVQAPTNTQVYNRYTYAMNNPMTYIDESGELWFVPIIIGAVIGGYSGYKIGKANEATGWNMAGYMFGGAVIGGIAGYAGASLYGASLAASTAVGGISAAFEAGFVSGMASGFINSGGMTALAGGDQYDILSNAISGSLVGGFSSAVGAASHTGMQNLFKESGNIFSMLNAWGILPKNATSYIVSSTASQATANVMTGNKPFKRNNFGLNFGLLLPVAADFIEFNNSLALKMAKKHNTENSEYEIYRLRKVIGRPMVDTYMDELGNLNLEVGVVGRRITPFNLQDPLSIVIERAVRNTSLTDHRWIVNMQLIPNYGNLINLFNIFNFKY